jgi:uncharacterized protein (TIGR03437 family)
MLAVRSRILWLTLAGASIASSWGANFGTVVPINGTVSDIALDERRNVVWAANFSAFRVEQVSIASRSLLTPMIVPMPPSAVAVSPNRRFLLVGEYQKPDPSELSSNPFAPGTGGYTLFDLDANLRYDVNLNAPVLSVAFGADNNAIILTRIPVPADPKSPGPLTNLFQLQPFPVPTLIPITSIPVQSVDLPVPLAKFPTQIGQATSGVSGDGNTIVILAAATNDPSASSNLSLLIHYNVLTQSAFAEEFQQKPPAGPRSVAVDQSAVNILTDWGLQQYPPGGQSYLLAEFPRPNGAFNIGSHAWDITRNLIYAQVPTPDDTAVLHIMATDNLTVYERLQMSEDLSGKSQMSSDGQIMVAASVSGVTILPIGQLPNIAQVGASQEAYLFAADACNRLTLSQTITILSLSSVQTDFTLSLPTGTAGVTLSSTSGTTPAQIVVTIDPTVFQNAKGTTTIPLTITSNGAVNLPPAVNLLVNTRDFNQRGQILNIPGKLVDILGDPGRGRFYVIRQDGNLVAAFDMTTLKLLGLMRTGNTPTQMAMTADQKYLLVGNDNSQIANVFDLDTFLQGAPIVFPGGHYPRSIGVANTGIFALSRLASQPPACTPTITGAATLDHIDFTNRVADTPCTLSAGATRSIYKNGFASIDGILTATPASDYLLLAMSDGNVLEYADSAQTWVASRADLHSLGGAYQAFSGNLFLAGPNLLNNALVPLGPPFAASDGTSSGAATLSGVGLRTTAPSANTPGVIQRFDLTRHNEFNATLMAEAPQTAQSLLTPVVGQIGESILSFTRTLAVSPDQTRIFALTTSGITVLNSNFDAVLAKPLITGITNSADGSTLVATGGVVNINGFSLATGNVSAGSPPLPTSLGEVCALVNNIALPLFSVAPSSLVAQLPDIAGPATLVVHNASGISDPFSFTILPQAPAIFQAGGLVQVFRMDNNQPVNFTNPVHPNSELIIYLAGLGLTNPLPALGTAAPSNPLAVVSATPAVTLGGASLSIVTAALVPGQIGVYAIIVKAPATLQNSPNTPLTITAGGISATYNVRVVSP